MTVDTENVPHQMMDQEIGKYKECTKVCCDPIDLHKDASESDDYSDPDKHICGPCVYMVLANPMDHGQPGQPVHVHLDREGFRRTSGYGCVCVRCVQADIGRLVTLDEWLLVRPHSVLSKWNCTLHL